MNIKELHKVTETMTVRVYLTCAHLPGGWGISSGLTCTPYSWITYS